MSRTPSFTPRDIRLMIGFGLFVEVVLCYMLLIDGSVSQLHKLNAQLSKSQEAYVTLEEAVRAQGGSDQRKLPPVLTLQPGESCSLALQGFVDRLTARHGVTPVGTTVLAQEAPNCRIEADLQGSYEALGALIAELERPEFLMGLEDMEFKTDPADPDRVDARLTLHVYYRQAAQ